MLSDRMEGIGVWSTVGYRRCFSSICFFIPL